MSRLLPLLAGALALLAACHPGPIVDTGPKPPPPGGTIAGLVLTEGKVPVPTRKVTAVEVSSGARFETTTGVNGGYTIKVPEGRYRIEVELRDGERVVNGPVETTVETSDLDAQRNIVIGVGVR